MCGIVAYIGSKQAYPILIKGLERLEYRGYDSAGVALLDNEIKIYKKAGKVQELKDFAAEHNTNGNVGIGHTRWATHGEPNEKNAHPHFSSDKKIAIIHNGIIENYAPLKAELQKRGHEFSSDTDTEVLVHLIEDVQKNNDVDLLEAVRIALNEVTGAYAIVVMSTDYPNQLIGARKGSPLVVGMGQNDFYIASDATPIIEYTKNVVYLDDEEIALLDLDKGLSIKTIANHDKTPYVQELEMKLEMLEKGGYEHFMLKEIYEQPRSNIITMETAFVVRTFFFVIFGLTISLVSLLNLDVALISGLIILSIYVIRFVILRLFLGKDLIPQLFVAPRGLITILLFYAIPKEAIVPGFEAGILLFIIIGTSLIMTFAMVYDKQRAGKAVRKAQGVPVGFTKWKAPTMEEAMEEK